MPIYIENLNPINDGKSNGNKKGGGRPEVEFLNLPNRNYNPINNWSWLGYSLHNSGGINSYQ